VDTYLGFMYDMTLGVWERKKRAENKKSNQKKKKECYPLALYGRDLLLCALLPEVNGRDR
jgi:hypothetical protein